MPTGGGAEQAVTLTADLVARAVIAAAQAFGDDPVRAFIAKRGVGRRCMTPAARGISDATGEPFARVAGVLGIRGRNLKRAEALAGFEAARVAAMRAVEYACWRPEAAESVAGGADEAEIQPRPERATVEEGFAKIALFGASLEALGDVGLQRPPAPVHVRSPEAESPIADLILNALAGGAVLNTMSLATVIDRKEMGVASTLARLEHEGLVVSEPSDGPRRLVWRLAEPKADAA